MSFPTISVREIASLFRGEIIGSSNAQITDVSSIDEAKEGDLTFITKDSLKSYLSDTKAAAVLVDHEIDIPSDSDTTIIRVSNPYFVFLQIIKKYLPDRVSRTDIHLSAQIANDVKLGERVYIGPFVVIEPGCEIGDEVQIEAGSFIGQNSSIGSGTRLFPNTHIAPEVTIGKNVIIQSGTVIGSDGFGYVKHEGEHHKIPHLGTVVIDDEVEIGANCCIDRGTFGKTHIHKGVKLDNLIHVAHNVEIGEHTVIAAQTGISGSTKIGNDVTIAGQVGFVGHIEIGDKTIFGAQAGVTKSIPAEKMVSGYPARDHMKAKREEAALRRLPELIKRVRELERTIAELSVSLNSSNHLNVEKKVPIETNGNGR